MNQQSTAVISESFQIDNPVVEIEAVSSAIVIQESRDGGTHVEISTNKKIEGEVSDLANINISGNRISIQVDRNKGRRLFFGASHNFPDLTVRVSLPGSAQIDAKTVSGPIRIENATQENKVTTVSGEITVLQNARRANHVKTVSGDVMSSITTGTRYSVKTVSGNVEIALAPGLNLDVNGNSLSGATTSEIALDGSGDFSSPEGTQSEDVVIISANTVSGDIRLRRLS